MSAKKKNMDYLNQAVTDKSGMGKLSGSEKKTNTETKLSNSKHPKF